MSQHAFATLDANKDDRLAEAEFMSGPHAAEEPSGKPAPDLHRVSTKIATARSRERSSPCTEGNGAAPAR
jgi:hypothetical protein